MCAYRRHTKAASIWFRRDKYAFSTMPTAGLLRWMVREAKAADALASTDKLLSSLGLGVEMPGVVALVLVPLSDDLLVFQGAIGGLGDDPAGRKPPFFRGGGLRLFRWGRLRRILTLRLGYVSRQPQRA